MEYCDLLSLKSDVWGCFELQHHNGSRIGECRYRIAGIFRGAYISRISRKGPSLLNLKS